MAPTLDDGHIDDKLLNDDEKELPILHDVLFVVVSDKYIEPCVLSPELAAIVGEPRVSVCCLNFMMLSKK